MNILTKRRTRTLRDLLQSFLFFVLIIFTPAILVGFLAWNNISKWVGNPGSQGSLGNSPSAGSASHLSWLSTSGSAVVDGLGRSVVLRGVNIADLGWVGYEEWTPRAITVAIRDWKANVIRVRIYEERFLADPDGYLSQLDTEVIAPARQLGAYVILHPFLKDRVPLPTRRTGEMWRIVAQRYKEDPTVLYDPLDEPHDVTMDQVRTAYAGLIETIRSVNPKALIFVTGLEWGREINDYALRPLPYPNLVYRSNPYNEPEAFEGLFGKTIGILPLFIGEFGSDSYPPMSQSAVRALLTLASEKKISWTAWTFHSVGCPCLLSDFQNFKPSSYGEIVKQFLGSN